jgi:hypothetical protein
MNRRKRQPSEEEVHEAIMRRIHRMTREDWLMSIEELSRAPEGVEDPWPPYGSDLSNGPEAPLPDPASSDTGKPLTPSPGADKPPQ